MMHTTALTRARPVSTSSSNTSSGTQATPPYPLSAVDRVLSRLRSSKQQSLQIGKFLNSGNGSVGDSPAAAARALYFCKHVVLCTGPDNAAGSVFLGEALKSSGAEVGFVADEPNGAMIRKGIRLLHPELTPSQVDAMVHIFQLSRDGRGCSASPKTEAHQVLQLAHAVVAVGVPAVHAGGEPPISEVLYAGNDRNLLTVSIDKGDYRARGTSLAVRARHSNAGACAVGLILLKLRGKLSDAIPPDRYESVMKALYGGGAMVGRDDGNPGMSIRDHMRLLSSLHKMVYQYERVPRNLNTPTDVGVFDSSNGAFIAANVLKEELRKLGYGTNFMIVVDHGNAPYGQYTGDKEYQLGPAGNREAVIYRLVSNGLVTMESLGAALGIMACNTACTRPEAQKTVKMPVLDLILVTAKAMAMYGGNNPVMISTPVTALSRCYPAAVLKESKNKINLMKTPTPGSGPNGEDGFANMIGAPRWAPAINNLEHLDESRADEIKAMVEEIVDKVPEDATSVWLTCTHYPALQELIQDALSERGLDIRVINPMVYQARAAAAALLELERKDNRKVGKNLLQGMDRVFTSGDAEQVPLVEKSAQELYRSIPVEARQFGQNSVRTFDAIADLRSLDANAARRPALFRELLSTLSGFGNLWTPTSSAS